MTLPQGVTLLRSGRFRARASIDGKLVHLGVHDTAEEAVRVIAAARAIAREQESRQRDTFRAWADAWLDERETSGAHRSSGTDRSRMTRHVFSHAWSEMPLRAIRVRHLRDWLHALERTRRIVVGPTGERTEGGAALSPSTVRHVCNLVRRCFADAIDAGKITENPAMNIRPRRTSEPERAIHLSAAEIERLLAVPGLPDRMRAIYATAIFTGMRAGELWALRWEDVHEDADHPELVVRASHRTETKTGKVRHVPILAPLRAILGAWRRADGVHRVTGLVFPCGALGHGKGWSGWHQCGKGYDAEWKRWASKAGIDTQRVKFRHLRHTCGSHLAAGTWGAALTLYQVAAWLGHSDSRTTERHYAHLTPQALRGARAALDAALTREVTRRDVSVADAIGFEPMTFGSGGRRNQEEDR